MTKDRNLPAVAGARSEPVRLERAGPKSYGEMETDDLYRALDTERRKRRSLTGYTGEHHSILNEINYRSTKRILSRAIEEAEMRLRLAETAAKAAEAETYQMGVEAFRDGDLRLKRD